MKSIKYSIYIFALLLLASCEQEVIELQPPEVVVDKSCEDATAGSADFTKFVAIGSSYTAGFQAGALFNEGQNNSLGKILSTQFACAGGGVFNQPDINSEHGYNIFITPNPMGNTVLGRFKLQGTPPAPAPVVSGTDALPNPQVNPGFIYTGSTGAVPVNQLNNFGVQAIVMGQAFIPETGKWSGAGTDPRFNPFYARFASDGGAGTATLFTDAISSLTNGGTFFLFWLGMDDVLLHAVYGGDPTKAPLTPLEFVSPANPGFKYFYNNAIQNLLANPTLKGVIANYPDIFVMPHFTSVRWNVIAFTAEDEATINGANSGYAPYNGGLEAAFAAGFPGLTEDEVARRKIEFKIGSNGIVIEDETLTDLSAFGLPSIRQTTATDVIPLAAGSIIGKEFTPGDPSTTWGVGKALTDQYALIPSEITEINTRLAEFNTHIKSVADANANRLAFADVNQGMKNLVTARAGVANNVTITPNINPPTGIYSEEGLHPNSRGYSFIANTFIDAINAKFGASVPKVNLAKYGATALPINP